MKYHIWHIIILVISFVLLGAMAWTLLTEEEKVHITDKQTRCLAENEVAEYELQSNRAEKKADTITIIIRDRETGRVVSQFTEQILQAGHYHPVEMHRCGVYFAQSENYDYTNRTSLPGYISHIFKTDYDGNKEPIVVLDQDELGNMQSYESGFSSDFRVDNTETYITLTKGYLGEPGYELIVRDLTTGEDVLVLDHAGLNSPAASGEIDFMQWTEDSRYFWISFFVGATTMGWMRIDATDWSYELYPANEGILNGYPLNIQTGWVPMIPGAFWTGGQMLDEQVRQQRLAEGSTADLYLYNIMTKEKILVEDTDEAIWRGLEAIWLDDQTLEYRHPSGERKTYSIPRVR